MVRTAMQDPWIRPGAVAAEGEAAVRRVVALFRDAAQGNVVIQRLVTVGVRSDQLGVTAPDRMPEGRGMVLSVACPTPELAARVEEICKGQGAELFAQGG